MTDTLQASARGELARIMGDSQLARPKPVRDRWGRYKRDPGGQWDWFYELDPNEREYISRRHMGGVLGPDELATWLDTDIDSAMAQWLTAVRAARGRITDPFEDDYELSSYDDDVTELVGPDEVCEMLGVKRPTIAQWRFRGILPEPTIVLSSLPIWDRRVIEEWAKSTGREIIKP